MDDILARVAHAEMLGTLSTPDLPRPSDQQPAGQSLCMQEPSPFWWSCLLPTAGPTSSPLLEDPSDGGRPVQPGWDCAATEAQQGVSAADLEAEADREVAAIMVRLGMLCGSDDDGGLAELPAAMTSVSAAAAGRTSMPSIASSLFPEPTGVNEMGSSADAAREHDLCVMDTARTRVDVEKDAAGSLGHAMVGSEACDDEHTADDSEQVHCHSTAMWEPSERLLQGSSSVATPRSGAHSGPDPSGAMLESLVPAPSAHEASGVQDSSTPDDDTYVTAIRARLGMLGAATCSLGCAVTAPQPQLERLIELKEAFHGDDASATCDTQSQPGCGTTIAPERDADSLANSATLTEAAGDTSVAITVPGRCGAAVPSVQNSHAQDNAPDAAALISVEKWTSSTASHGTRQTVWPTEPSGVKAAACVGSAFISQPEGDLAVGEHTGRPETRSASAAVTGLVQEPANAQRPEWHVAAHKAADPDTQVACATSRSCFTSFQAAGSLKGEAEQEPDTRPAVDVATSMDSHVQQGSIAVCKPESMHSATTQTLLIPASCRDGQPEAVAPDSLFGSKYVHTAVYSRGSDAETPESEAEAKGPHQAEDDLHLETIDCAATDAGSEATWTRAGQDEHDRPLYEEAWDLSASLEGVLQHVGQFLVSDCVG